MARETAGTGTGFSWTVTDGGRRFMVGKDAVHDAHAWGDLDGDGCIDLVAIATESGNYEDTDHELVAIHVPTGTVGWRALPGEVSKKVSKVGGAIVASTDNATRLRGIEPRTGQQLWSVAISDRLKEDPFDGDDRAPAIVDAGGSLAAFECEDDTWHLLDVRTGQIVRSGEGKFVSLGTGVPGLLAIGGDGDQVELFDTLRGRSLAKLDASQIRVVPGASAFGVIAHGETPSGDHGVYARFYDNASFAEVARTTFADGVESGAGQYGVCGGFLLAGNRLFFGSQYNEGPWVVPVVPNGKSAGQRVPPPQPGYVFRAVAWVSPAIVTVWEKDKGTPRLIVVGHDPSTLAPVWQSADLGGRHLANVLHTEGSAVLVPHHPNSQQNEYQQHANECSIRHLDPSTGAILTHYPMEDVNCVEMQGRFLCGAPTFFSGGLPVAYDIARRERVL
jgi:hypothetical protein